MSNAIGARITQVIEAEGLTNNSFAKRIGVSAASIGYITGERQSKPGFDIIEKIASAFPDINMDWLVRGYGLMRKEGQQPTSIYVNLLQNERSRYSQLYNLHGSLSSDYDVVLSELKP